MVKIKKLLFLSVVLFVIAGALSVFAAEKVDIKLSKIQGKVDVMISGETQWKAAKEGMKLSEGASIRTGEASSAFLTWKDGHAVKIQQLTVIKVDQLQKEAGVEKNTVSVTAGKVFSKVSKLGGNSSFNVKTPTAIAGVRGTAWETEIKPDNTVSVSVVDGSVNVQAGGAEITINMNFQTTVPPTPGAVPSEPNAIPEDKLQELQADNQEVGEVSATEMEAGEEEVEEEAEAEEGEEAEEETGEMDTGMVSDIVNDTLKNAIELIENVPEPAEELIPTGSVEMNIK
ncbi:MAG: FecR domain-containing protein [bacterium]